MSHNFTCQLMCQELILSAPSLKVVLEFDFTREARVMDTVADNLKVSKTADWCTITFYGVLDDYFAVVTWISLPASPGLMAHVANAQSLARTVEVPRSVPGLATQRLLVMSFVEGDQITRLEHRTRDLSARWAS